MQSHCNFNIRQHYLLTYLYNSRIKYTIKYYIKLIILTSEVLLII